MAGFLAYEIGKAKKIYQHVKFERLNARRVGKDRKYKNNNDNHTIIALTSY